MTFGRRPNPGEFGQLVDAHSSFRAALAPFQPTQGGAIAGQSGLALLARMSERREDWALVFALREYVGDSDRDPAEIVSEYAEVIHEPASDEQLLNRPLSEYFRAYAEPPARRLRSYQPPESVMLQGALQRLMAAVPETDVYGLMAAADISKVCYDRCGTNPPCLEDCFQNG